FRAGYLPRVGDPVMKNLKTAVADVQLKQGLFGINVRILPPNIDFLDKPLMRKQENAPQKSSQPETVTPAETETSQPETTVTTPAEQPEEEEVANTEKA